MDNEFNFLEISIEKRKNIDVNKLHTLIGHPCKLISLKTGKEMDLEVIGKYEECFDFSLEKISQKKINQENVNKSTIPGERIYFDLSSVQ